MKSLLKVWWIKLLFSWFKRYFFNFIFCLNVYKNMRIPKILWKFYDDKKYAVSLRSQKNKIYVAPTTTHNIYIHKHTPNTHLVHWFDGNIFARFLFYTYNINAIHLQFVKLCHNKRKIHFCCLFYPLRFCNINEWSQISMTFAWFVHRICFLLFSWVRVRCTKRNSQCDTNEEKKHNARIFKSCLNCNIQIK